MNGQKHMLDEFSINDLIRGIITLMLVGSYIYLVVTNAVSEDLVSQVMLLVVGFWLGSKSERSLNGYNLRGKNTHER